MKTVLIVLLIIVILFFILAAIAPRNYSVVREVIINKPKDSVFKYIKFLKNQDSYSKWATMDPNMKKEYRGTDGTVGFVSAWDSDNKNVGKGEQEIKKIFEGQRIDYEIRFIKPFKSTAPVYLETIAVTGDKTKVRWGFSGSMKYPMNIMLLFMNMEKMIGNDFDTGLARLKEIMEK